MRVIFAAVVTAILAAAQVTEKDMDRLEEATRQRMERLESQSAVIMQATQVNQEAIVALNLRLSLSDQDQDRMDNELRRSSELLAEIRDEAVYTRVWFSVIIIVFGAALKSREILAMLGKRITNTGG